MDEPHAVQEEPGPGDLGTEKCPHPLISVLPAARKSSTTLQRPSALIRSISFPCAMTAPPTMHWQSP